MGANRKSMSGVLMSKMKEESDPEVGRLVLSVVRVLFPGTFVLSVCALHFSSVFLVWDTGQKFGEVLL